jgi:hypothetical protein
VDKTKIGKLIGICISGVFNMDEDEPLLTIKTPFKESGWIWKNCPYTFYNTQFVLCSDFS